jgi:hypothetical protein
MTASLTKIYLVYRDGEVLEMIARSISFEPVYVKITTDASYVRIPWSAIKSVERWKE